jgi:electron transfer flavoprotein alpha subunit
VAAVLVHIDLDGARPNASSLQALAAGRVVASSWGATLYAAVIVHDARSRSESLSPGVAAARVPGEARAIEAVRAALARGGADKIVVVKTEARIAPLWSALGPAWQAVLDHLRPRLVVFGADAPSASELGPRTAARIGARLFLRARAVEADDVELRDRDGSYVRAGDSGAAVMLVGAAPRLAVHSDDDIDVMVLAAPGEADPRIELVSSQPAAIAHTTGTLIALGDEAAAEPDIARAAHRLARALGAHVVGSAAAATATAGVIEPGAVIERGAPLAPELCIAVGIPAIDVAGAASLVRVGSAGGKGVDGALTGPITSNLAELARALEGR